MRYTRAVWAVVTVFALGACTWRDGRPMGYWGHGMHPVGYGGFFMWLFVVILAAVVIYYAFWRSKDDKEPGVDRGESALEIVKKRYAKGEITREEYERFKHDLE